MQEPTPTPKNRLALQQALAIAQPLALWLMRSGVGYKEFAVSLKTVFLQAAQAELERIGGKQTDSALCLLSGLHRKDVRALLPEVLIPPVDPAQALAQGKPSAASQVVTRWLTELDGQPLPVTGAADAGPSFESLASSVSRDIRPRSLLLELTRLGVVLEQEGSVSLVQRAFVPDARQDDAARLVAGSVSDHLNAAVHNLTAPPGKTYLEQSVFADGLTAESVHELEHLANQLWHGVLAATVKAAQPLSDRDEALGGRQRIRLGMFCYSATMEPGDPRNPPPGGSHGDGQDGGQGPGMNAKAAVLAKRAARRAAKEARDARRAHQAAAPSSGGFGAGAFASGAFAAEPFPPIEIPITLFPPISFPPDSFPADPR